LFLTPQSPASGFPHLGFNITQSGPTTGTLGADMVFNQIDITADQSNTTFGTALKIVYDFGGSNLSGPHTGLQVDAYLLSPSSSSNPNRAYVGIGMTAHCGSDGGTGVTSGTAKGSCYGTNPAVSLGATSTNLFEVTGGEADVAAASGATAYMVVGWNVVKTGPINGAAIDSAFLVGATGVNWGLGYGFTDVNGGNPIASTGTLFGSQWVAGGPYTVGWGIDVTGFIFNNAAWHGNLTLTGHFGTKGATAPTNTGSCAGFVANTGSSDLAGSGTYTSATTCTIGFNSGFTNAPFCFVSTSAGVLPTALTPTSTTLAITFGSAQTGFTWHCIGS
jgi:hypothetical protein